MPAAVLDFPGAKNPTALFGELATLAKDPDFQWIAAVVNESAEQFVARTLPKKVEKHAFASWMVDENFDEASRCLNNALDVRSEALALAAQGVQAALELQLAMQADAIETEINEVGLKASYAQAGMPPPAEPNAIRRRAALLNAARTTQLALHNAAGSALNYGERVSFLRSLYADNVAQAYGRLYAIWLGLEAHLGIVLDEPPTWAADYNDLFRLVHWLREANKALQEGQSNERRFEVCISLMAKAVARDALQGLADFQTAVQQDRPTFDFNILNTHDFPDVKSANKVRLLGIGVGFGYAELPEANTSYKGSAEERGKYLFALERIQFARRCFAQNFEVELPSQTSSLKGLTAAESQWPVPRLDISGASGWIEGGPLEAIRVVHERQFINSNPNGPWRITVRSAPNTPGGFVGLAAGLPDDLLKYLYPNDVVVVFRVAVREA